MTTRVFDPAVFDHAPIFDTETGHWSPRSKQSEVWTSSAGVSLRVFDPAVFDPAPIFDTDAGHWSPRRKQSEIWTVV